jgi:hypothetical protein
MIPLLLINLMASDSHLRRLSFTTNQMIRISILCLTPVLLLMGSCVPSKPLTSGVLAAEVSSIQKFETISKIRLPFDSAQGEAFDSAQGEAFDSAQGEAFDSAQGEAFGCAQGALRLRSVPSAQRS